MSPTDTPAHGLQRQQTGSRLARWYHKTLDLIGLPAAQDSGAGPSAGRLRRIIELLPYIGLALVLAVVTTWPAARHLSTHIFKPIHESDVQCGLWWPSACAEALVSGHNPFFSPNLAWPEGQDMTLLLWNFGAELLLAPIHLATGPVLGLNLSALTIMALNGLACAWAARIATGSRLGLLVGLVVGATQPFAWAESGSGRLEQALWAPIAVYAGAFLRLRAQPGNRRDILISALSLAAAGAIYWFYAYFLIILTGLDTGARAIRRRLDRSRVLELVRIGLLSFLFVLPFLYPVVSALLTAPENYQAVRGFEKPLGLQWQFALLPASYLGIFGHARPLASMQAPLLLFPFCAIAALKAKSAVRSIGWMGILAGIFAAGPVLLGLDQRPLHVMGGILYLPMALLNFLPGYSRMWWPYRWLGVAVPAMAVSAAWCLTRLKLGRFHLVWLSAFCLAECFLLLRLGVPPGRAPLYSAEVPPIFLTLREEPWPSPILYAPIGRVDGEVAWQAVHGQPVDIGLAWHIKGVRGEAFEKRRKNVPLFVEVDKATSTGSGTFRNRWSEAETAGFRYVQLSRRYDNMRSDMVRGLTALLGPPRYLDARVGLWAVPGMGQKPISNPKPAKSVGVEKGQPTHQRGETQQ